MGKTKWKAVLMAGLMAMAAALGGGAPAYAYGTQVTATPIPQATAAPTATPVPLDPKTGLPMGTAATPTPSPTPQPKALTPEGNMKLVDDISGAQSGDKDFLVIQSRNGQYFYIVVDRANQGANSVHFLNQVDEGDLLAAIEDGASPSPSPAPLSCTCVALCQPGEVDTQCPVCALALTDCQGVAPAATATPEPSPSAEPEPQPEKPAGMGGLALAVLPILAGGGVFAWFKLFKGRAGKPARNPEDLEEDSRLEQALNAPAEEEDGAYEFEEDVE